MYLCKTAQLIGRTIRNMEIHTVIPPQRVGQKRLGIDAHARKTEGNDKAQYSDNDVDDAIRIRGLKVDRDAWRGRNGRGR